MTHISTLRFAVSGLPLAVLVATAAVLPAAASAETTPGYPVGVFGATLGTGRIGDQASQNPDATGPVMHASITGSYDRAATRTATLDATRATRQAAYDEDIPVQVNGAPPQGVKEYLASVGRSESSYVNIVWSDSMEAIAQQRAAEASVFTTHLRPDWSFALPSNPDDPGGVQAPSGRRSNGEVLGFGHSDPAATITQGYNAEKPAYLAANGEFNQADGHYYLIVTPENSSVGMARITLSDGYAVDVGELGDDTSDPSDGTGPSGTVAVPFLAAPGLITVDSATLPVPHLQSGSGERMQVLWVSDSQFRKETFTVDPADVAADGTFTSSDPGVARVSPDGTVTGMRPGTATITYTERGDHSGTPVSGQSSGSAQVTVLGHPVVVPPLVEEPTCTVHDTVMDWLVRHGIFAGPGTAHEIKHCRSSGNMHRAAMETLLRRLMHLG